MSLEMKNCCQSCQAPLVDDGVAFICSYECTYCATCADSLGTCPNCSGELMPRPRRGSLSSIGSLDRAPSMTAERLDAFAEAWGRGDVAALSTFITDDCVYGASVGPEPGTTYSGRSDVERGFREILAYEAQAGGDATSGPVLLHGHRAVAQWAYTATGPDGEARTVRGCDLFELNGPLIRRKDAFIKSLPLPGKTP